MKTYSELITIPTFEQRFEYLKLEGQIGIDTFGFERYLNQIFYKSLEWRSARNQVIIRDNSCDLGLEGYEIFGPVIIHHMNPISKEQILDRDPIIFDPEYLITTRLGTHNAIHYGNIDQAIQYVPVERKPNDTCPWRM